MCIRSTERVGAGFILCITVIYSIDDTWTKLDKPTHRGVCRGAPITRGAISTTINPKLTLDLSNVCTA